MCGIAGVWYKNGIDGAGLARICMNLSADLKHRGPDDEGFVLFDAEGRPEQYSGDDSSEGINLPHISEARGTYTGALIHRRLSVITPGIRGHQPMYSPDGRYWIVYNGETFNYKSLDAQYGFENRSDNDAETALNLVTLKEQNGPLELDGFHALAVYDRQNRQLELYRDPTGVKPLFYTETEDRFAFCSETVPLRKLGSLKTLNTKAVFHLLAEGLFLPDEELVTGIRQVPHKLVFEESRFISRSVKYQVLPEKPKGELKQTLMKSIESRLMSDVPLGFAVSGGLDSAIIIGAARKILGKDAGLKLFSITSTGEEDESHWQQMVADHNHAEWHQLNIEQSGPGLLEEVVRHTGMPAVAWNNLAQYQLARLARSHGITVFFNGQGADEIFGGYPDYFQRAWLSMPLKLYASRRHLPVSYQDMASGWLKFFIKSNSPAGSLHKQFIKRQAGWLGKDLRSFDSYSWSLSHLPAEQKMYADYFGQKLGQMLRWEDANGMAHSIESRNPFADDMKLAAWLNVSLKNKMENGYAKGLLRKAASGLVPAEVLWRVDKKGFTVPDSRMTWKSKDAWKDAFMSSELDTFSSHSRREKAFKNLMPDHHFDLKWMFRLTALSYFIESLRGEH